MTTFPIEYIEISTFWSKVDLTGPEGCWPWTKSVVSAGKGYGDFRLRGFHYYAHRVAYELLIGDIPNGLVIDHLCDNSICCNPYHMEPKTINANASREGLHGISKINSEKEFCLRGHPLTEDNLMNSKNKRTCKKCAKIRRDKHRGLS